MAIAAAMAWQLHNRQTSVIGNKLWATIISHTPPSKVREGIQLAASLDQSIPPAAAVRMLGNGSLVTAPDTVPFALWCAARHLHNYVEAMRTVIVCGGDCDTNAAIVGGIVALSAGQGSIPNSWHEHRERFLFERGTECDQ